MASTFTKYGLSWKEGTDPAKLEMHMIRKGGRWINKAGAVIGNGLEFHYLELRGLIWPKRYRHRWTDLIYHEILQNQMTILMGAASTGKTSTASDFVLLDYWCFPQNTAVLVSTTTREKLEDAVFGEIKMLFRQARELHPWLDGNLIDHKQAIVTDDIEDGVRDLRRGVKGKACYVGKQYIGLGTFAGIKQERVRFLADELQFMPATFLDVLPNMFSNPDTKIIGSGNPNHDPDTQLGIAAEPLAGWATVENVEETSVWATRFYHSRCVNLIGPTSPNFDVAENEREPYPRLIGRKFAAKIAHDYGINSPQYETQVKGRMKLSLAHSRVITRALCEAHHAHDLAMWAGTKRTKIHAADPAYGGGDRCIHGFGEFGMSDKGVMILRVRPPQIIKIDLSLKRDGKSIEPEDQISETIKRELAAEGVPPENSAYDSFGRGTVGAAFAKVFGHNCPIPIDSGGTTTERPVRQDLFVEEKDRFGNTISKRLKTCREEYSKFVTEMWFAVHNIIKADQMRELPIDVMLEGCSREYYTVRGDKIEVEPKADMKERTQKSPDLFDWLAILCEIARRRGFVIAGLGPVNDGDSEDDDWLSREAYEQDQILKRVLLTH